jgi:hypothetical protein
MQARTQPRPELRADNPQSSNQEPSHGGQECPPHFRKMNLSQDKMKMSQGKMNLPQGKRSFSGFQSLSEQVSFIEK